jgi:hypothetical protein
MFNFWRALWAFSFAPLCFGGSGGQSASTTTTNNADKRISLQSGLAVSGSGNTITTTDAGAINAAFDFAKSANANSGANYQALLNTTSNSLSGVLSGIASTQNFIASTQAIAKGTMDSKTIVLLGGGVLAVAAIYFAKGKK